MKMDDSISLEDRPIIPTLLTQLVFESNLHRKLNALDVIINACDDNIRQKRKIDEFYKWLHKNFLGNKKFMRKLALQSKIFENIETAIEYFGVDYPTHPEYIYDEEFSEILIELNKKINQFVGLLLKEYALMDSIQI